eukprot:1673431-Amphidinium_carterae.1
MKANFVTMSPNPMHSNGFIVRTSFAVNARTASCTKEYIIPSTKSTTLSCKPHGGSWQTQHT